MDPESIRNRLIKATLSIIEQLESQLRIQREALQRLTADRIN